MVVSGTSIRRSYSQIMKDSIAKSPTPIFSSFKRLNFELEIGAFLCKVNKMGKSVPIKEAEENIFGLIMMNN